MLPVHVSAVEENLSLKTHLSVSQTADILEVSVPTVYRYIKKRKLFANKIGCRETLIGDFGAKAPRKPMIISE